MASSRDAAVVPVSKRQKVDDRAQLREMVALQHTTKTSIVDALRVLKKAGLLDDCVTKRDLKKAAEAAETGEPVPVPAPTTPTGP